MQPELVQQLEDAITQGRTYQQDNIFLVGDDHLSKSRLGPMRIRREFHLGQWLHRAGVQVPEVYGVVKPASYSPEKGLIREQWEVLTDQMRALAGHVTDDQMQHWHFVMQRIKGESLLNLGPSDLEEANRQFYAEAEKILEMGIRPIDSRYSGNLIFGEDGLLYLIDFDRYELTAKGRVLSLRERILI